MAPRVQITRASMRPTDVTLRYFVHYYESSRSGAGTFVLWTDSREYAERFAAPRKVYARPCVVRDRAEWAIGRRIGLTETSGGHVTTVGRQ